MIPNPNVDAAGDHCNVPKHPTGDEHDFSSGLLRSWLGAPRSGWVHLSVMVSCPGGNPRFKTGGTGDFRQPPTVVHGGCPVRLYYSAVTHNAIPRHCHGVSQRVTALLQHATTNVAIVHVATLPRLPPPRNGCAAPAGVPHLFKQGGDAVVHLSRQPPPKMGLQPRLFQPFPSSVAAVQQ